MKPEDSTPGGKPDAPRAGSLTRSPPLPLPPAGAPPTAGARRPEDTTLIRTAVPRAADTAAGVQVEPLVGQILKGRYRLEERIGQGGMGIVFRATDMEAVRLDRSGSTVAIKVLNAKLAGHEAALFDEVQRTRQLQQENIVNAYSFERDESSSFMVMELLHGLPLDRFVTNFWADGMPLAQAAPLIRGMAAALTYAHQQGVIHSDFKPSNVFIVGDSAKVLDFGIARAARAGDARHVPGEKPSGVTPLYASCEMLEDGAADTRDDVFCFGIVVHFLLTGKHPFDPFTATQARDLHLPVAPVRTLSRWQNAALARMLRFDRDERSASLEEFLQRLRGGTSGPVRVAMGAAILLAVASLGYLYHAATVGHAVGRQDSDAQFVRSLCNHTGKQVHPSDADAQVLATLLELGNSYLRIGQDPYDPGILSENVSSALGAFQDALTLAPQNCDAAAQGILGVAKVYKSEAKRLYAKGDYRGAAQAAAIAQRIWRDSGEMRELLERIERRLPPGPNPQP